MRQHKSALVGLTVLSLMVFIPTASGAGARDPGKDAPRMIDLMKVSVEALMGGGSGHWAPVGGSLPRPFEAQLFGGR